MIPACRLCTRTAAPQDQLGAAFQGVGAGPILSPLLSLKKRVMGVGMLVPAKVEIHLLDRTLQLDGDGGESSQRSLPGVIENLGFQIF